MVVYLPQLVGERLQICRCGTIGLVSPIAARSTFGRRGDRFKAECRRCACARASAARRRRLAADPEAERAKSREYNNRYRDRHGDEIRDRHRTRDRERRASEPEYRRRVSEASRRYRERRKKDRARNRAALLLQRETTRINYLLRREREEGKVVEVEERRQSVSGVVLPIGPFREWLNRLFDEALSEIPERTYPQNVRRAQRSIVATRLRVSPRTLYRYTEEYEDVVDESVVDRCVCSDGRLTLWDLYPEQRDYEPPQRELPLDRERVAA